MTSRPLDFESSAYASSATSANRPARMVQPAEFGDEANAGDAILAAPPIRGGRGLAHMVTG